jgi:cellulose synthase/poly-beta-1,6-N-acetylglucosamine synthase-like glycosyltransferase
MNKYLIIGLLLLTIGGGAFGYVKMKENQIIKLQTNITQLVENNSKLETNNKILSGTIVQLNETAAELEKLNRLNKLRYDQSVRVLNEIKADAKLENDKIEDLNLGTQDPDLIEKIINSSTNKRNRCLELLTGSELNEKERNAKTSLEFNDVCPWLFNNSK